MSPGDPAECVSSPNPCAGASWPPSGDVDSSRAATELKPPRARVLIADDEAEVRELLRQRLTCENYLVSAVETGREVLDAVPTFQPDVIIVDMVMPGLCGADVLIALRRASAAIPVILISAHDVIVGEAFFAVLSKPLDLRMVAEAVASAVDHGRIRSA